MKSNEENTIKFLYKCKRPKKLENDVFVIYSPEKIMLTPSEIKLINMQVKIFLPKHITGSCRLLFSLSNQKLKLLNSSSISQENNQISKLKKFTEKKNTYLRGIYISNF